MQNGIVIFSEVEGDGYGNKIILYYRDNLFCGIYSFRKNIGGKEGAFVFEGEEIGLIGNTGNSSSNHLHFELFHKEGNSNVNIDPMNYLGK